MMDPLNTLDKAKSWAENRAKVYGSGCAFMVCKWNDGFIINNIKFVIEHIDEYKSDDTVELFKNLFGMK